MVSRGLPSAPMLIELVEDVLAGGWPDSLDQVDAVLADLSLARGDTVPGHTGSAYRLTGGRDLSADYLVVHLLDDSLVGFHALGGGSDREVQELYARTQEALTERHAAPTRDYDRRRPPSEVSHWLVGPARVSLFQHLDRRPPGMTIQLALEHIERAARADEVG